VLADSDAFVARWDDAGNLLWDVTWGGPRSDGVSGIALDVSGSLFVTGWTTTEAEDSDVTLRELDEGGRCRWARRWGGVGDESVHSPLILGSTLVAAGSCQRTGGVLSEDACELSDPPATVAALSLTARPLARTVRAVEGTVTAPASECEGASVLVLRFDLAGRCFGTRLCEGRVCPCGNDDPAAGCENSGSGSGGSHLEPGEVGDQPAVERAVRVRRELIDVPFWPPV